MPHLRSLRAAAKTQHGRNKYINNFKKQKNKTQEEKQEHRAEEIFEIIMPKSFQKLMTDTKLEILEAQRTPNRIKTTTQQNPTSGHVILKLQKTKDRENLEVNGKPHLQNKGERHSGFLVRHHASKRRVEWNISRDERKKTPI